MLPHCCDTIDEPSQRRALITSVEYTHQSVMTDRHRVAMVSNLRDVAGPQSVVVRTYRRRLIDPADARKKSLFLRTIPTRLQCRVAGCYGLLVGPGRGWRFAYLATCALFSLLPWHLGSGPRCPGAPNTMPARCAVAPRVLCLLLSFPRAHLHTLTLARGELWDSGTS